MPFVLDARYLAGFFFVASTKTSADELSTAQMIDCRVSRGRNRKTPSRQRPSRQGNSETPLVVRVPQIDAGVRNSRACTRLQVRQGKPISRGVGMQGNIK